MIFNSIHVAFTCDARGVGIRKIRGMDETWFGIVQWPSTVGFYTKERIVLTTTRNNYNGDPVKTQVYGKPQLKRYGNKIISRLKWNNLFYTHFVSHFVSEIFHFKMSAFLDMHIHVWYAWCHKLGKTIFDIPYFSKYFLLWSRKLCWISWSVLQIVSYVLAF
jgi:hypothetical protein